MLLTNDRAEVANEPDAMVVLTESWEARRVWTTAGLTTGAKATELVGTPDLVVEIVSPSSEDKDTEWLMSAYWNAGIPEYWLIDARDTPLRFDIFKRGAKGFTTGRKSDGWVKSAVLGRSFRLSRLEGRFDIPTYTLEVR